MPITVAIFDLDDTLYDCFGQRVKAAHRYASQAMVDAGLGATVDEVFAARMEAFRADPRLSHIDAEVCRRFAVRNPDKITQAARAAYFSFPAGKLTLFPATLNVLRTLQARGVRNFVVTFGDPETQRQKIAALGLDREPSIERIYYAERGTLQTKEEAFRSVLRDTGAQPEQVLVIGDRPDGEIAAANRLGLHTVRIRGGEFASLEARLPEEQAKCEITEIGFVLQLPFSFGVN
ncbi:MAG: HAD family hydrolase [Terriglobales bacterium]